MKTNRDSETLPDRIVIQTIYHHGGSRLYTESKEDGSRELIVDTFTDSDFAEAIYKFTKEWLLGGRSVEASAGSNPAPTTFVCNHDNRFKEVFGLPPGCGGCLACHAENLAIALEHQRRLIQEIQESTDV